MARSLQPHTSGDVCPSPTYPRWEAIALIHDWLHVPLDLIGGRARRVRTVRGASGDVLDVGIGTGLNLGLYSRSVRLTAIDVSERMLELARARAARLHRTVHLWLATVERLPFEAASFDTVIANCVFCSVDDPVRGLQEVRRVIRPGGHVRLLEPGRPGNALGGALVDWLIARRLIGMGVNHDIEADLHASGFEIVRVRRSGIWREIVAKPHEEASTPRPEGGPGPWQA